MIRWLFLLLILTTSASAQEEVIAGMSSSRISISANFDGSEILIFGAVKREQSPPEGELGVIVTVEGPGQPLTVRRLERRALIWVNGEAVRIARAPSFYAINTSAPLAQLLNTQADARARITTRRVIGTIDAPMEVNDATAFSQALIRIRKDVNLYQTNINAVELREETLFNTTVTLPANLVEGIYISRIFLTRNGEIVATSSTAIDVEKIGLEKFLYNLAYDDPLIYALLSIALAIGAGWGASAAFRYLQS
ncbi:uncharacterized protein (TIGR02186 family) [Palleronia aestuarii]|uniref:Uncharacterized protein (TIGR02186 family) n=1 Tax=Palleronia aestuarii TaxID=568105 RepID=A0A2W7NFU6_9RHOB|nr:TIGR02186 family protein [Palleronia aestuarii]PZX18373.1 uncharacterized protein (TIGR02186 family) [Palleronia aestuarii]